MSPMAGEWDYYHEYSSGEQQRPQRDHAFLGDQSSDRVSHGPPTIARSSKSISHDELVVRGVGETSATNSAGEVTTVVPPTGVTLLQSGDIGFHEESHGMGKLSDDMRQFIKGYEWDDLLSTVSERQVRVGGVHRYCVRFGRAPTGMNPRANKRMRVDDDAMSPADGIGFVFLSPQGRK